MESKQTFLTTPLAIIIGAVLISFSVLVSSGVVKIKGVNSNSVSKTQPVEAGSPAPTVDNQLPSVPSGPVKVSVDDDPVLGDKNAALTLIEFSDYECPFCKRHFEAAYQDLKKNYIDTGKVKLVFRDLPLSFHDPMATTEAIAANCAREQGGDSAYFKMHDVIFTKTTSNGNGLSKDDLYKFSTDLGLNAGNFKSCLDTEKYKDEVAKDLADASAVGASGTPSFFIGKSSADGIIEGTIIVGAQPYSAFQAIIDQRLSQ